MNYDPNSSPTPIQDGKILPEGKSSRGAAPPDNTTSRTLANTAGDSFDDHYEIVSNEKDSKTSKPVAVESVYAEPNDETIFSGRCIDGLLTLPDKTTKPKSALNMASSLGTKSASTSESDHYTNSSANGNVQPPRQEVGAKSPNAPSSGTKIILSGGKEVGAEAVEEEDEYLYPLSIRLPIQK